MKSDEQLKWEQEVYEARIIKQKEKKDFSYHENGEIERCKICKSFINSYGHCPKCDY